MHYLSDLLQANPGNFGHSRLLGKCSGASSLKELLGGVKKHPKCESICTGGCTDEQAKQCHFEWQQHQPLCDFPVNNCHPRPILQPQSHFRHGNSLPLSHRTPHHNLHGHPHTFPSGQSEKIVHKKQIRLVFAGHGDASLPCYYQRPGDSFSSRDKSIDGTDLQMMMEVWVTGYALIISLSCFQLQIQSDFNLTLQG